MKMHWYDYAIILAIISGVIILSLFIYLRPHSVGTHKYMEISRENEVIYKLDLNTVLDEVSISIDGKMSEMKIIADHDGCYVLNSGCPDHVCIETGKIIDSNDNPIICVPNAIQIRIVYE